MNVTVEKLPKCLTEVSATFPAEEVAKEKTSITSSYSAQARIPGFRPGKAPKRVIEKRFAKEIEGELEYQFINKVLTHTVKEEKINFLNVKDRNILHEEDGALKTTVTLIVSPEFELGEYKNVPVTVPNMEITDEILENEILQIRRQQAQYPTKEEGALEEGEIAVISYSATFEGADAAEAFDTDIAPYATQDDYWIKAGDDHFLPGFSSELINMVVGSEKKVAHTFAEDFSLEALQGKTLDYTVTLKEVKEEQLPEVEELAQKMMGEETTVEDFRDRVKAYIVQQQEKSVREIKVNSILEKLGEGLEFDVPEEYLTAETQSQADQLVKQGMNYGMDEEAVVKMQESIIETASANAEKSLKNHFILQKIADLEEIEVAKEEIMQKVYMDAYQRGEDPKKVMKQLQKSGDDYQYRQSILMDKVVDFLVENADITTEDAK